MLNASSGWFTIDVSSETEMGSYHQEHWIMILNLENIPPCLIPNTSLFKKCDSLLSFSLNTG